MLCEEEETTMSRDMDLSQVLEKIRNDFSSKIKVSEAIQDVKKKRSAGLFYHAWMKLKGTLAAAEYTVNSEKAKSDTIIKQVTLLKNNLDELENCSRQSNLRTVRVPEKTEGVDAVASGSAGTCNKFTWPPIIERTQIVWMQANPSTRPRVLIVVKSERCEL